MFEEIDVVYTDLLYYSDGDILLHESYFSTITHLSIKILIIIIFFYQSTQTIKFKYYLKENNKTISSYMF